MVVLDSAVIFDLAPAAGALASLHTHALRDGLSCLVRRLRPPLRRLRLSFRLECARRPGCRRSRPSC